MSNKFSQRGIYTPSRQSHGHSLFSLFLQYHKDPKYLSLEELYWKTQSIEVWKDTKQTNKKFTFKSHEDS